MLDQKTEETLISFLGELLEFYREFLKLEADKQAELQNGRLDRLDARMKEEQAYVLRARGLELRRQKLMERTPQPKATFRELIVLISPARQEKAREIYEELSSVLLELRETNQKSSRLAGIKLRQVSAILAKLENRPDFPEPYGEKAGGRPSEIFSKKI